jgi:hypothetical protein
VCPFARRRLLLCPVVKRRRLSLGLRTVPYYGYGCTSDGSRRVYPSCSRTVFQHTGNSNGTGTGKFTAVLRVTGGVSVRLGKTKWATHRVFEEEGQGRKQRGLHRVE